MSAPTLKFLKHIVLALGLFFYAESVHLAPPALIPENGTSLRFMVLADWGGLPLYPYRTDVEKFIAASLGQVANNRGTQFQLALGDNFYFDGVKDVSDKRFQTTFENVFTANSLQNDWYLIAGNHDWNGNVTAQIAYSAVSKRWHFPSFYYSLNFTSPDGATVEILMLDTVVLCGNSDDRSMKAPSGPSKKEDAEEQWEWIESSLRMSRSNYLIVAGHYPIYSIAEHGPTDCLVNRLKPLLYKYNASTYFSGHDHSLQHIQEVIEGGHMDYFVIGSANFVENSMAHKAAVPKDSLKFFNADSKQYGGFAYVEVDKTQLSLTFVSGSDSELYQATILPRAAPSH